MEATVPYISVTKLDAARRQIETAILLYFNDRDTLAIHTLAAAAQGILHVLAKRAGKSTPLQESLVAAVPEGLRAKVEVALRGPQNFLKHADRDPDRELQFSPELTEFILYDAVSAYFRITGEKSPIFEAFVLSYAANHPDFFSSVDPESVKLLEQSRRVFGKDKLSILETALAHSARIRP
jgi:hypothetical protein